jgi:hypothetical protein
VGTEHAPSQQRLAEHEGRKMIEDLYCHGDHMDDRCRAGFHRLPGLGLPKPCEMVPAKAWAPDNGATVATWRRRFRRESLAGCSRSCSPTGVSPACRHRSDRPADLATTERDPWEVRGVRTKRGVI